MSEEPRLDLAITLLMRFSSAPDVPVSRLLKKFFRQNPALGGNDRACLRAWIYRTIRYLALWQKGDSLQMFSEEEALRLLLKAGSPCPTLASRPSENYALAPEGISEVESFPPWLWQQIILSGDFNENEAPVVAESLNRLPKVDLRVNSLKTDRQSVLDQLKEAQISAIKTPWAPQGLRLPSSRFPEHHALVRQGCVEIQNEGSQLVSHLVAPQEGQLVIDLCAGEGGKTLHLAALMKNQGKIIATDIHMPRLKKLRIRCQRAGVKIVQSFKIEHERDRKLRKWLNRADAVLVDAPCSGLGTLRRHPELRWRYQTHHIEAFHHRQYALLAAGASLLRSRGRLIYVTCSLLKRENQDVVEAFLAENRNFRPLVFSFPFGKDHQDENSRLKIPLTLWPHKHQTDGFFIAVLQKQR
ncbi:RsmB/NOP family class I SAM-dependent RNA methyltransferase [Magnetococcales bacterium HHB-1]